jgi:hypothetical protein
MNTLDPIPNYYNTILNVDTKIKTFTILRMDNCLNSGFWRIFVKTKPKLGNSRYILIKEKWSGAILVNCQLYTTNSRGSIPRLFLKKVDFLKEAYPYHTKDRLRRVNHIFLTLGYVHMNPTEP